MRRPCKVAVDYCRKMAQDATAISVSPINSVLAIDFGLIGAHCGLLWDRSMATLQ
jgi:hypothetical protein